MSTALGRTRKGLTQPADRFLLVTPSDTVRLPFEVQQVRIVGTSGNLAMRNRHGEEAIVPVTAGETYDFGPTHILATGTTATGIWVHGV